MHAAALATCYPRICRHVAPAQCLVFRGYSQITLIRSAVRTHFGPEKRGNLMNQRLVELVFGGKLVGTQIAQSCTKNGLLTSVLCNPPAPRLPTNTRQPVCTTGMLAKFYQAREDW
jgi:hypothetical protein